VLERADERWSGERGLVTAEIASRHIEVHDGRPIFVAGPPPMVQAMQAVLDELGVSQEQRRIEWFGAPSREGVG
jgi:NAD(P)H-flavin reductase